LAQADAGLAELNRKINAFCFVNIAKIREKLLIGSGLWKHLKDMVSILTTHMDYDTIES